MNVSQKEINQYFQPKATVENGKAKGFKGVGQNEQSQGSLSLSNDFLEGIKKTPIRQILSTRVENNGGIAEHTKDEKNAAVNEKVRKSEDGLDIIKDTLSGDTTGRLFQEGKSLEDLSPDELAQAVLRIRMENVEKQKMQEDIAKNRDAEAEEFKEAALSSKLSGEKSAVIAEMLEEAGLPATEESISRIMTALTMAQSGKDMNEDTIKQLLAAEKRPTIDSIYQAGYTPARTKNQNAEELFASLKPQVEGIIMESGLILSAERNEDGSLNEDGKNRFSELLDEAKWLLKNNLPITGENLWQLECMKDMKNLSAKDILEEIIYSVGNGKKPEKTDLSVTIGQVRKDVKSFQKQVERITERRRMEEIRIRMTVQSGYILAKQGIKLDVSNMEKIVEGLKSIEDDYYKRLMEEAGAEGTKEQTSLLKNTMQCIDGLKGAPADLLALTSVNRFSMTLTSLSLEYTEARDENGNLVELELSAQYQQTTVSFEQASSRYETLQTQVRPDLGDSLSKAFGNVDSLLDEIGMEKTQENQRAVRILGRNSMTINQQNVNEIKAYDRQVNYLFEHLHPAVAAKMIKDGMNPLEIPIYELNQKIDKMREEMGISDEEKYSSYLYKLEQNDQISEDERSAYIGLFRLIHNVKQGENAAVGQLLETGQQITLSNLLTAVRNRKAQGFDQKLDTDFQGLSSLSYESSSITAQLNRVFGSENEAEEKDLQGSDANLQEQEIPEYYRQMLDKVLSEMSPERVSELLSKNEDIMSMSLENFAEEVCGEDSDGKVFEDNYYKEISEEFRETAERLLEGSSEELRFLESLEQPQTFENLNSIMELWSGKNGFYQKLFRALKSGTEEISADVASEVKESNNGSAKIGEDNSDLTAKMDSVLENMEDEESLNQAVEEFTDAASKEISEQFSSEIVTSLDIRELIHMNRTLGLVRGLSGQRHYEIPMVLEDEIVNVSLTILSGKGEGGKVHISMADRMEAEFMTSKEGINGYLMCINKEFADLMNENKERLASSFSSMGYENVVISVGVLGEDRTRFIEKADMENSDTRQLYQIAKKTLQFMKVMSSASGN